MGRRKIEIQPITHERNRSVTFLKRKNGLFKKAYELGVLCSVDVAVIIFEERAGHHLKLYQYCSGDVQDIVQRHIRYDGEKDTRTPHDFANNAHSKVDDAGDGDDDDVDDDDTDGNARGPNKKTRADTKLKQDYGTSKLVPPTGDVPLDANDYPLHRPMTIPQPPMPLHHATPLQSTSTVSSLPISTERHTSSGRLLPPNNTPPSQKQPRIAPSVSAGNSARLTPDDTMYNSYLPSPTSAHPASNYRQNGQLPYNYQQSSFDLPSSSRNAPLQRSAGYSLRTSTYPPDAQLQTQGMYQHIMRNNLSSSHPPNGFGSRPQQSPDLLSAFLDNGDDHRPPPTHPPQFAPIDWPSHAPPQQAQAPPQPQQESGHPGDTSWLDFLSHSAQQSGAQPSHLHMALPLANGRDGVSWERDREMQPHYAPSERGGAHMDKGLTNGTGLISPPSRKRPRADSSAEDTRRPSPILRGKAGLGQDMLDPGGDVRVSGVKEE